MDTLRFVGWNRNFEGIRFFFSLELDGPYRAINGAEKTRLYVYTSTGRNTGEVCDINNTLCIIPCFGAITVIRRGLGGPIEENSFTEIEDRSLQTNIMKADYFGFTEGLTSPDIYHRIREQYYDGRLIDNSLITEYFGNGINPDAPEYMQFKMKVGSNHFLKNILDYRNRIVEKVRQLLPIVNNGVYDPIYISHISHLNPIIGTDNFFDLNLFSEVPSIYEKLRRNPRSNIFNTNETTKNALMRLFTDVNGDWDAPYITSVKNAAFYKYYHRG